MIERFPEDADLLAKAQAGDRSAFNALIRKHEAKAYQYAYRLTRNPDFAADVVAEAFVRVLHALGNFKGQSAFSTWLYRILTNCYLDMKKREQSRATTSLESVVRTAEGEVERQIEDPGEGPQIGIERNQRAELIQDALSTMPEYQRAMIVMYHAENMSYEEIAAALDLPIGTVKSRLNRARVQLRELLAKDEELFRF